MGSRVDDDGGRSQGGKEEEGCGGKQEEKDFETRRGAYNPPRPARSSPGPDNGTAACQILIFQTVRRGN